MQLPREQLKEILDKQPEMKPGLWQYVLAKNGPVKAQTYADVSSTLLSRLTFTAEYFLSSLAFRCPTSVECRSVYLRYQCPPGDTVIFVARVVYLPYSVHRGPLVAYHITL
jgi:hypothetical protein